MSTAPAFNQLAEFIWMAGLVTTSIALTGLLIAGVIHVTVVRPWPRGRRRLETTRPDAYSGHVSR